MKDAMIVFVGIGVLLLLPILFFAIRCVIRSKKEKDYKYLYHRLAAIALGGIALFALLFNVYGYTVRHQAPLVAEEYLVREGYHSLEELGLDPGSYTLFLSENAYEDDDESIRMYSRFDSKGDSFYTEIRMKQQEDGWQVLKHEAITDDPEKYPEIKKRFYPIKAKP